MEAQKTPTKNMKPAENPTLIILFIVGIVSVLGIFFMAEGTLRGQSTFDSEHLEQQTAPFFDTITREIRFTYDVNYEKQENLAEHCYQLSTTPSASWVAECATVTNNPFSLTIQIPEQHEEFYVHKTGYYSQQGVLIPFELRAQEEQNTAQWGAHWIRGPAAVTITELDPELFADFEEIFVFTCTNYSQDDMTRISLTNREKTLVAKYFDGKETAWFCGFTGFTTRIDHENWRTKTFSVTGAVQEQEHIAGELTIGHADITGLDGEFERSQYYYELTDAFGNVFSLIDERFGGNALSANNAHDLASRDVVEVTGESLGGFFVADEVTRTHREPTLIEHLMEETRQNIVGSAITQRGSGEITIGIFLASDNEVPTEEQEEHQAFYDDKLRYLATVVPQDSYGRITVNIDADGDGEPDVFGPLQANGGDYRSVGFSLRNAASAAGINIGRYDYVVYVMNSRYFSNGVGGYGNVGMPPIWVSYGVSDRTLYHELGHNFGRQHSSTYGPDGELDEYGDREDVMGKGYHFNVLNRLELGYANIFPGFTQSISETGTYALASLTQNPGSTLLPQALIIPFSAESFVIGNWGSDFVAYTTETVTGLWGQNNVFLGDFSNKNLYLGNGVSVSHDEHDQVRVVFSGQEGLATPKILSFEGPPSAYVGNTTTFSGVVDGQGHVLDCTLTTTKLSSGYEVTYTLDECAEFSKDIQFNAQENYLVTLTAITEGSNSLSRELIIIGEDSEQSTCSDGIQNGDEEGVDCGGSCPSCNQSGCTGGNVTSGGTCKMPPPLLVVLSERYDGPSQALFTLGQTVHARVHNYGKPMEGCIEVVGAEQNCGNNQDDPSWWAELPRGTDDEWQFDGTYLRSAINYAPYGPNEYRFHFRDATTSQEGPATTFTVAEVN